MAQLLRKTVDLYHDVMENKSDPRVKDWFLMGSPFPTYLITLTYIYIVKYLGPKLMENRKPFELKKTIICYNIFQIGLSTWLFYEACVSGWMTTYSYTCQPVDYSTDPIAVRTAKACWWYFISKFTEFFDTFFFVLRKKNNQISTLHVIHHSVLPVSVWWGVKFIAGGNSTFFGFLNTFVHIIMYTYYLLASLGPGVQKYLWWKKYLTSLQIIQFVLMMIHSFQLFFIECDYPKMFSWFIGMHSLMFYFLFSKFYKDAYTKKKNEENLKKNGAQAMYKDVDEKITKGYTSSENDLRNRAFIDRK